MPTHPKEIKWLVDDTERVELKGKPVVYLGDDRQGGRSYVVKVTHVKIDGTWAKISPQVEAEVHGY